MDKDIERELKILLTKDQYDQIRDLYQFDHCYSQTNTYYDTNDQKIRQMGGAFRIRNLPDGNVTTLKLPIDSITKQEYENPTKANSPEELTSDELKFLKEKTGIDSPLIQTTRFTTCRCDKKMPNATLSLDKTDFGSVTDYELEYEYSEDHDGISEFNRILAPLGLHYEKNCLSKLGRAAAYRSN